MKDLWRISLCTCDRLRLHSIWTSLLIGADVLRSFTPNQQRAIDETDKNILVSAAAGSGKTAVLVERILRVITDKDNQIDIGRLLVVTFTEAAALEMRERILKALNERLIVEPDNKHIQKQVMLMPKASISTIHSFCNSVLRKNYSALGLDPSFRIGDDIEMDIVKEDVLESIFEREYEQKDEAFYRLLEIYGGRLYDRNLRELILRMYSFCESSLDMRTWILESAERFNLDEGWSLGDSVWGKMALEQIETLISGAIISATEAIKYCEMPYGPHKYNVALRDDLELLKHLYNLCSKDSFEEIRKALDNVAFTKLASISKKDKVDDELKEIVKNIRDKRVKATVKDINEKFFFKPLDLMRADIIDIYSVMKKLCDLVIEFMEGYKEEKLANSMLDFGDLEHYTYQVLSENEDIAAEYREQFAEIYTDEYQDSNSLQESILSLISKDTGRFMVGDVKQSIYRFRRANPDIFIGKYNSYEDYGQNLRIDLSTNFRSRANVLASVNFIFRQIMSERAASINYGEAEMLRFGGQSTEDEFDDSTELILIETSTTSEADDDSDEEIKELSKAEKEGKAIAAKILELTSKECTNRAEYRDITILMRSLSHAQAFVKVLTEAGIPTLANTSGGYFDNIEVLTMVALLRVIDNPRQDISLIATLHSPIYSLSADDLAEIRICEPKGDFYSALKVYLNGAQPNEGAKRFWNDLERWRKLKSQIPVSKLISTIFDESGYFDYISLSPQAETKKANLNTLFEHALRFEKTSLQGLLRFIHFIEKLMERDSKLKEPTSGISENAVQIMTIHRSKGLEFPICFVSNLGSKINRMDESASLIMHEDKGLGPIHMSQEPRVKSNTLPRVMLSRLIHEENYAEELRILYVALTRAKSKLILTGCVNSYEKAVKSWAETINYEHEKLPPHIVWDAKTYVDFIGACLVRHKSFGASELLSGNNASVYNDESRWSISIINRLDEDLERKDDSAPKIETSSDKVDFDEALYESYLQKIGESFGWEYENIKETIIPSKISISEIKRNYFSRMKSDPEGAQIEMLEPTFNVPKFASVDSLSPAEKGMAMHTLMEHIDIKATVTQDDINALIDNLVARNLLSDKEARSINVSKVYKFISSPLAERMRKATELRKEIPFVLEIDAKEAYLPYADAGTLLVHGIIDCYFVEDGRIILVDYKSDYVGEKGVAALKSQYKVQLDIYRKALEKSFGADVSEAYLYLFDVDECVDMM